MDIRLYDNFEEDGQLSLFGFEDADYEMEVQPLPDMSEETADTTDYAALMPKEATDTADGMTLVSAEKAAQAVEEKMQKADAGQRATAETAEKRTAVQRDAAANTGLHLAPGGSGIRIRKCATCGKHLFVSEVSGGYASSCNNCGIEYFQKV